MAKEIIETTLGDLIEALSDEMERTTNQQQEIYNIVAYLLADLLHNRSGRFRTRNYEVVESMDDVNNSVSWH